MHPPPRRFRNQTSHRPAVTVVPANTRRPAGVILQKTLHIVYRYATLPRRDECVDLLDARERVLPAFLEVFLARIPGAQEVIRMRDEPGAVVVNDLRTLGGRLDVQDCPKSIAQPVIPI